MKDDDKDATIEALRARLDYLERERERPNQPHPIQVIQRIEAPEKTPEPDAVGQAIGMVVWLAACALVGYWLATL